MVTLVSFDIDGTLEVGDPPGIVTIALVQTAKRLGYVIGSCSDRPISHQQSLWERLRIAVDFTVLKHELASVKARFDAAAYYHKIGRASCRERVEISVGDVRLRR